MLFDPTPQVFYGILVQHFAILAGERPLPTAHLDALIPPLLALTQQVGRAFSLFCVQHPGMVLVPLLLVPHGRGRDETERLTALSAVLECCCGRTAVRVMPHCTSISHCVAACMLQPSEHLPGSLLCYLPDITYRWVPQVPMYAATVARARLQKMNERLTAVLADPSAAGPGAGPTQAHGWPHPRVVLLLQLFSILFPTSDRRRVGPT